MRRPADVHLPVQKDDRRAWCEAGSHHGEKLSVYRAMSGLESGTVSQLRVGRGKTRDHPTRSPESGDKCLACVSAHGRTGVFGRVHSLTKELTTVELESVGTFVPTHGYALPRGTSLL